jgi:hypothetical protein
MARVGDRLVQLARAVRRREVLRKDVRLDIVRRCEFVGDRFEVVATPCDEQYVPAVGGEQFRQFVADTARRARHECRPYSLLCRHARWYATF